FDQHRDVRLDTLAHEGGVMGGRHRDRDRIHYRKQVAPRHRPAVVSRRHLVCTLSVHVRDADEVDVGEFGIDAGVVLAHAPDADDSGLYVLAHTATSAASLTAFTISVRSDDDRFGCIGSESTSLAARSDS